MSSLWAQGWEAHASNLSSMANVRWEEKRKFVHVENNDCVMIVQKKNRKQHSHLFGPISFWNVSFLNEIALVWAYAANLLNSSELGDNPVQASDALS